MTSFERVATVVLVITVLTPALAATAELGFSRSVTPGLVERYASLFGASARGRLKGWQDFMQSASQGVKSGGPAADVARLLERVNEFVNRLPAIPDIEHWKVVDYWATSAESFASNGGDCEDFVIAKYFALKELGVPIERLRIVYVRQRNSSEAHMVLAYYAKPDAIPLILDNLFARIVPANERPDLTPVFSFNDDDLALAEGYATAKEKASSTQIRQWKELLAKLRAELTY
jgi:predicted transglutaminase-like cysteine proteinase